VLSGGQAPGGHNVIAGVYDFIKDNVSRDSVIIGFLDGPQGIYNAKYSIITDAVMDSYRNSGGFDMIGSGRHKIEKPAEFAASLATCTDLDLDGLVVIGGDDSNTNAAVLAEYFEAHGCKTKVCGVPKTIDGDLKVHPYIPVSFGFDTACRTYSELIGNLGQDTLSTQKYYHFIRLMGRAASNIALECALETRPNICLISEEVEAKHKTLAQITQEIVDIVVKRWENGKDYGIVLLPEGLIEFIPEFNGLIKEINDVLARGTETTEEAVLPELSYNNRAVFSYLPANIKQQLLLDRDPHGNVQVAKIETEKLLAQTVAAELDNLHRHGKYDGHFAPQFHSYGYEGRSGLPSVFDATYCYVLGQNVAALLTLGLNGLISSVVNLNAPVSQWVCGGVPITMMCHMERRHGHMKPVIKKALVELDQLPFQTFAAQRADWAEFDLYRNPGPLQFSDVTKMELSVTLTLELCGEDPRMNVADLTEAKAIQSAPVRYSSSSGLRFAPLKGDATKIYSAVQQSRAAIVSPPLCNVFVGSSRGTGGVASVTKCTSTHSTQSNIAADRRVIAELFPHTYGAKLVTVTASSTTETRSAPQRIGVW
jgi:diphosphate--fructose-6-phosphate 1-phosphotransferase